MVEVVSVTKKGQATIPKRLRIKYGIKTKLVVEETECGIVLKPLPSPEHDLGSLKDVLQGRNLTTVLEEAQKEELRERQRVDETCPLG